MISKFFDKFKEKNKEENSAGKAKERLQIIIASNSTNSDFTFMPKLEKEILELIKQYIPIAKSDLEMDLKVDDDGCKMLELNVNLPEGKKLNLSGKK